MRAQNSLKFDLMVIGSGLAGMATALFAAKRGFSVAMAGASGGTDFGSGLLDMLGVSPLSPAQLVSRPLEAIARLAQDEPEHPYARTTPENISSAFDEFVAFLGASGLEYKGNGDENSLVMTFAGTAKPTFRLPATMWAGTEALRAKARCLVVDFPGLRGFSAAQMAEVNRDSWPGLTPATIEFPGANGGELYPERLSSSLTSPEILSALCEAIAAKLDGHTHLGLPPVLGLLDCAKIVGEMRSRLGVEIFEIPSMPPCMPGTRLRAAVELGLSSLGVRVMTQQLVTSHRTEADGFVFRVGRGEATARVETTGAVLATGRFFSQGLKTRHGQVYEPLFGLPVSQPEGRHKWHRKRFYDPAGHLINRAGVEVDDYFRPLGFYGHPLMKRLHAAGSILAHQDWMRQKCGAGVCLATAREAVDHFAAKL